MAAAITRRIPVDGALDLRATLAAVRRGRGDPCLRLAAGEAWRATRTPDGPAAVHLVQEGHAVVAEAWGPGAARALEDAPALVGALDHPERLVAHHDVVRTLHGRLPGLRIPRTGAVAEALVATVLEQKVTGLEARASYRALVLALGEPAPGPAGAAGMVVPPTPEAVAAAPSWAFHRWGVERKRADTIRRACARAARLEEAAAMALPDAYRRLQAFPGVGQWSAAEVALVALGDADAVPVGDYNLPSVVSWALAGQRRGTDPQMLELLEPYRGHRARVLRLLTAAGTHPPRRGPRFAPRAITRM